MLIPVGLQIVSRYTGIIPRYIWTEEAARFCFVWMIMIGSVIAVRQGTHFEVDLLPNPKTQRTRGWMQLIVHLLMGAMALAFFIYGIGFAESGARQRSEMSGINMLAIYISFPLAGFSWLLFLIERMWADFGLIRSKNEEVVE